VESRAFVAPTRIAVLIPTLNEEEGLRATFGDLPFAELRNIGFDATVVVVDGHSTDSTAAVAKSLGTTFFVQRGKGKGAAVREGLEWAGARGIPYAIVMDADFTYPGAALPAMATLLAGISSRLRGGDLVLPLLAVPMFVPALIAGVKASAAALGGAPLGEFAVWLKVLVAFDVMFVAAGYLLFEYVAGEE